MLQDETAAAQTLAMTPLGPINMSYGERPAQLIGLNGLNVPLEFITNSGARAAWAPADSSIDASLLQIEFAELFPNKY